MKRLVCKLGSWAQRHPLAAPMAAAAVARLLAATVGMGFHARDDYFHVLDPALHWLADPSFDWDGSSLAGAGIRSHLVPRLVWLLLEGLATLGVSEPSTQLACIGLALGAYSLLVVPGCYLLGGRLLDARGTRLLTWLAALHFAMPYAGTRLLIEAMAMVPLVFGIYFASFVDNRRILTSGLLIGLACWFRFQVGAAALGVAVALAVAGWRAGGLRDAARRVTVLGAGGAVAVATQGLFDLATTGRFLGPVVANIAANLGGNPDLTRSTALAYVGLWLVLTVPPATVVVLPAMLRGARGLPLVVWPFALFVLAHSCIGHKEERFMLPVLPLFLTWLAAVPGAVASATGPTWQWLKRGWPLTRAFLLTVHALALVLAVTNQTQAGLRQVMDVLRHDPQAHGVISLDPEMQLFFLGRPDLPVARLRQPDAARLRVEIQAIRARSGDVNRFFGFAADRARHETVLRGAGLLCQEPQLLRGWWLDRIVYGLNPRHNRRRSPIALWRCSPE